MLVCVRARVHVCVYVCVLGVDRYTFFRTDTDYYRSSRPITDMSRVKMKLKVKMLNKKSFDKDSLHYFNHIFISENLIITTLILIIITT